MLEHVSPCFPLMGNGMHSRSPHTPTSLSSVMQSKPEAQWLFSVQRHIPPSISHKPLRQSEWAAHADPAVTRAQVVLNGQSPFTAQVREQDAEPSELEGKGVQIPPAHSKGVLQGAPSGRSPGSEHTPNAQMPPRSQSESTVQGALHPSRAREAT